MNPIAAIEKLINEHGSATILKERLALAADQFGILEQKLVMLSDRLTQSESKNADLESENQNLKSKVTQLEKELKSLQPTVGGFVKSEGVLWMRTEDGFERQPYCPLCRDNPVMMYFGNWWTCPSGSHTFDGHLRAPSKKDA